MPEMPMDMLISVPSVIIANESPPGGSRSTVKMSVGSVAIMKIVGTASWMTPSTMACRVKSILAPSISRSNTKKTTLVNGVNGFGSPTRTLCAYPNSATSRLYVAGSGSTPEMPSLTRTEIAAPASGLDSTKSCTGPFPPTLSPTTTPFSISKLQGQRRAASGFGCRSTRSNLSQNVSPSTKTPPNEFLPKHVDPYGSGPSSSGCGGCNSIDSDLASGGLRLAPALEAHLFKSCSCADSNSTLSTHSGAAK
mmetsp:Transcript_17922/g.60479  ORF Transcript_17922/g.60479 Transcript_17922/m.60479 type:complete len:251 (+) Transcript_17922:751-1503(+)